MTRRVRIEKGVPLSEHYLALYEKTADRRDGPSRTITGEGRCLWPFRKMEVGDSFKLPLKKVRNPKRIGNTTANSNYPYEVRMSASRWGRVLNRTFLVLKDDNHQWRCWRTE